MRSAIGLVALDPRHRTHNIPGKFLTYMQSGLPVLASVKCGERPGGLDRAGARRAGGDRRVGGVAGAGGGGTRMRCRPTMVCRALQGLSARLFSAETAVRQIVAALA